MRFQNRCPLYKDYSGGFLRIGAKIWSTKEMFGCNKHMVANCCLNTRYSFGKQFLITGRVLPTPHIICLETFHPTPVGFFRETCVGHFCFFFVSQIFESVVQLNSLVYTTS